MSEAPPPEVLFIHSGERVFGTHLYPVRRFEPAGAPAVPDASTFTEVIRTIPTAGALKTEVLLTRMSGLFVRVPEEYQIGTPGPLGKEQFQRRLAIVERIADAMNQVICELALLGVTSDPASPNEIGVGFLDGGRAGISSSGSMYNERVLDPVVGVFTQPFPQWFRPFNTVAEAELDGIEALEATRRLLEVSDALPAFVAAAYAVFQRRLLAEALVDAWIVIEQVVNWLWREQYRPKAHDSAHRARLDDYRSFTANTKLETLLADNLIEPGLYDELQAARRQRNDTAHGANVDIAAASTVLEAMHKALEFVCDRPVAMPSVQQFVLG
jgi:hypothetical protein